MGKLKEANDLRIIPHQRGEMILLVLSTPVPSRATKRLTQVFLKMRSGVRKTVYDVMVMNKNGEN